MTYHAYINIRGSHKLHWLASTRTLSSMRNALSRQGLYPAPLRGRTPVQHLPLRNGCVAVVWHRGRRDVHETTRATLNREQWRLPHTGPWLTRLWTRDDLKQTGSNALSALNIARQEQRREAS